MKQAIIVENSGHYFVLLMIGGAGVLVTGKLTSKREAARIRTLVLRRVKHWNVDRCVEVAKQIVSLVDGLFANPSTEPAA